MENSKPLATESFSYSWLIHKNPSSDCVLKSLQKFHENSTRENSFRFDFPVSESNFSYVFADEIISDGYITPTYVERSRTEAALGASSTVPATPIFSYYTRIPYPDNRSRQHVFPGKWRKSSKRILKKCVECVRPFYQSLKFLRKNNRVDDLDRKVCEVESWSNSLQASPCLSRAYSDADWADFRKSTSKVDDFYGLKKIKSFCSSPDMSPRMSNVFAADVESSINEAILYCKRSIEK